MNFYYLQICPDSLGGGILMVSLPEEQEQPAPKLESLVRAICQRAIESNSKFIAYVARLDFILACTMRVAPALRT